MRAKLIIAIFLAMIVAIPACAQDATPWDVRPYLSTYTDATYTWNFSAVRHRFVCPHCGYSMDHPDAAAVASDYTCPDPFDLGAGHPTDLPLVEMSPRDRVLSELDVLATDADGDDDNPLVGRPFHPGGTEEPDWNADPSPWEDPAAINQGSYLNLRAANLDYDGGAGALVEGDGDPTGGTVADDDGLRFLVLEPGAVRPAARATYLNDSDTPLPPGTADYHRSTVPQGTPEHPNAGDYTIHVNPYRVSDGDVFYIWHYERSEAAATGYDTEGLEVEVYSTLYGNDFDSDPNDADDGTDELGNLTQGFLNTYNTEGGCQIITDSGALRVDIPRQFSGEEGEGWWVIKVQIHSNATMMPRPEEVNYDPVYGDDLYNDEQEPAFPADLSGTTTAGAPDWKQSFVYADTTASPVSLATAEADDGPNFPVYEKQANGDLFTSTATAEATEIWPYRMPPEAAGMGRVILQWSDCAAPADLQWRRTPLSDGRDCFYNSGREWYYMVDPADPTDANRLVENADIADDANQIPLPADARFIDSYFMCSRVDVDRTADMWAGRDPAIPAETDTEGATGGYPNIILGEYQDSGPTGWVGRYAPGSRTPQRVYGLDNRSHVRALTCPVGDIDGDGNPDGGCGARYQVGEPFPDGDDNVLGPGDPCPACGAPLVPARGEIHLHHHADVAPTVTVGGQTDHMTPDAFLFDPSGVMVPIGASDFEQAIQAEIPPYQPPSVPAGSTPFANDFENDDGYRGRMVAFNRPDAEDGMAWNSDWDAYFLSPWTGDKYVDAPTAADPAAQWFCSICGAPYDRNRTECEYCGHTFTTADDIPEPPVSYDAIAAEEFDPFDIQISVLRETGLAADQPIVDLGWVAPGTPDNRPNTTAGSIAAGSDPMPTDVSDRSEMPVRNEGNIDTETEMRSTQLLQTGVDQSVRSVTRWAQTVPITLGTLFRYRPGPPTLDAAAWSPGTPEATGAAGERNTALLQAGIRSSGGEPYPNQTKPVPNGQPVGNYASDVLLFVDLNGDGDLDFYDAQTGRTDRPSSEFDPGIDEPFEPVAPFTTRARVVESRLPQNDFYSSDTMPTVLHDEANENLQVLWVGKRAAASTPGDDAPAGTGPTDRRSPTAPTNILYSNAQLQDDPVNDPLYRGWLWAPAGDPPEDAMALSVSNSAGVSNTTPRAWVDENTGDRWVMWHRSQASGQAGAAQLRFDTSPNENWNGSDATEFIFGSSGAHSGLTGFTREGAANAHWLLWHSGPKGREHLRYRWEWDPTSGTVPGDERLMVANAAVGQRTDTFTSAGTTYRKPALNPFTFVKQPTAFGTTAADGGFQLDVLYTAHIRALGNSDICWSRFNFGDPATADFPLNTAADNFGKIPFRRVVGSTYEDEMLAATDARGMPAAYDANGDVAGYVGDQLESSPRRQSFQARDIDWLVTEDFQTDPDWFDWLTTFGEDTLKNYDDPKFYVGVLTRADDTAPVQQLLYSVDWSRGSYDASTGLYTVVPRLIGLTSTGLQALPDAPAPADPADPPIPSVWHPKDDSTTDEIYWRTVNGVNAKALLAPSMRDEAVDADLWNTGTGENLPAVTLKINPASGMVQWSSSLFNPDNPYDSTAVFNRRNTPNLVDVVMYADYTPFIRRATTDRANDDSPSAFWNQAGSGRMTVFWRRSYSDTDTPHFGRPSLMHRSYTRAIQVGHPPIDDTQNITVVDRTLTPPGGPDVEAPATLLSPSSGTIDIDADPSAAMSRIGHWIDVTYTDEAGNTWQSEDHRVVGWSVENPVPINAVSSEGPLRVIPEVYTVDWNGQEFETVRYWLAWSGSRGVYDMRTAADDGQRVHQSPDVYLAVVAPDHSSLIADIEVPRLEP